MPCNICRAIDKGSLYFIYIVPKWTFTIGRYCIVGRTDGGVWGRQDTSRMFIILDFENEHG